MDENWRQLRVGDRIRLLYVPENDLRQRERERLDGAEMAGWTADTLERIMAIDPVVTISEVDKYGVPWFRRELTAADGEIEYHSLAITDDESWERVDQGLETERLMQSSHDPSTKVACTIAPLLSVRRGAEAVEFYKSAFGAVEVFRVEDPSGAVVARLSVDGAEFWMADESPEHANFSPETVNGSTARMILTVADPDTAFDRAVAAGAKVVVPVGEAYGWRMGRVVDPYGHHWEIGRPLAE